MFTRVWFSYLDAAGQAHKPFVLPQQDPEFCDWFPKSMCVPELAVGPVPASARAFSRAARSAALPVDVTGAPKLKAEEWQPWH